MRGAKSLSQRFVMFGCLTFTVLLFLPSGCARSSSESSLKPLSRQELLSPVVKAERRRLEHLAEQEGTQLPEAYRMLHRKAAAGQWDDVRRIFAEHEAGTKTDPKWLSIHHMFWSSECLRQWPIPVASLYAQDVLATTGSDRSVLFTGTDPGRFLVPMFSLHHGDEFPVVLSLNALMSQPYLAYLGEAVPRGLVVPDERALREVSNTLSSRVRIARIPKTDETAAQLTMVANGLLAKHVLEENAGYSFYVDEGYVVDWMYPYLEPAGLLMRLNAEQLAELTAQQIADDFRYWDAQEKKVLALPDFRTSAMAQATYAKLRSAIAGLYVFHNLPTEAEKALRQALRFDASSPEAHSRLIGLYLAQNRFRNAQQQLQKYASTGAKDTEKTRLSKRIAHSRQLWSRQQELEELKSTGEIPLTQAIELADIYRSRGLRTQYEEALDALLWSIEMPSSAYDIIMAQCVTADRIDLLVSKSQAAVSRDPDGERGLLNMASAYLLVQDTKKALETVQHGLRAHGDAFRKLLHEDKRLTSLLDRIPQ